MKSKREKRKKIFYVPGIISLVFIPLLCLYYFYKIDAFKVYSSLEFFLPNKDELEKYKVEDLRKYKIFKFEDNRSKEQQKLKELKFFVHDLVRQYDTINGAKIHFGSKTDYDTFVSVISMMSEVNVPTWALFKDNIYVLANAKPRPKKDRGFVCGNGKYSKMNSLRMEEENQKKELQVFQLSFLKQQWIIFLGYLGIVVLNIFTLVKFNKTR
ncbi:hypothetical protein ACQKCJ_11120 [Flavobacterium sp. NPDC079362]|uniref:hypothetical protein n=1 Tax=Flavobacterium sp. NPDC079362 TaxID=3390566 RepID=UPI003D01226E